MWIILTILIIYNREMALVKMYFKFPMKEDLTILLGRLLIRATKEVKFKDRLNWIYGTTML